MEFFDMLYLEILNLFLSKLQGIFISLPVITAVMCSYYF